MTVPDADRDARERADARDGRDGDDDAGSIDGDDAGSIDGDDDAGEGDERGPDPSKPVRRAFGVVSRRPVLLFAFALAAVVVAAADVARILDPVGNAVPNTLGDGLSFSLMTYPSGTRVATLELGAVVGLRPTWLLAALALTVVAPLAAGTATAWTVARAANHEFTWERAAATSTYAVAVALAWQATSAVAEVVEPLLAPLFVVGVWLSARLFPAPALAALDRSPLAAASEAYALTRGRAIGCALSAVGVGTLGAALANAGAGAAASASDPLFALGTALSYTFAGTVGAVAATIYAVEAREERERWREQRREQRREQQANHEAARGTDGQRDADATRGADATSDDARRRNGN